MDTARLLEFIGNHPFLFGAAGVLLLWLIVSELRRLSRPWREAAPNEVVRLVNGGAGLIDVRGADAYRKGHLPEARNIPLENLADRQEGLVSGGKPIVVYCDAGFVSARAAQQLCKAGAGEVHVLKGGLTAWQRDGLPVIKA